MQNNIEQLRIETHLLSTVCTSPRRIITGHAEQDTIENASDVIDNFSQAVPRRQLGISFQPTAILQPDSLLSELSERNIQITSISIPTIETNIALAKKLFLRVLHHKQGHLTLAPSDVGWRLTNKNSIPAAINDIEAARMFAWLPDPLLIRGSAYMFYEPNGIGHQVLQHFIDHQQPVIMSIQIHAEQQSPEAYYEFIQRVQADYKGKIKIAMDFDPAHMERSTEIFEKDDHALHFYAAWIREQGLIVSTSVNQHQSGTLQTHHRPPEGVINFSKLFTILGQAMATQPEEIHTISYETAPADVNYLASPSGLHDLRTFLDSYQNGYRSGFLSSK